MWLEIHNFKFHFFAWAPTGQVHASSLYLSLEKAKIKSAILYPKKLPYMATWNYI